MTGLDLVDLEKAIEYFDVIEKEMQNNTRIVLMDFLIRTVNSVSASALIDTDKKVTRLSTYSIKVWVFSGTPHSHSYISPLSFS